MIDDNTLVSGAELSALLGITERRVQQLATDGTFERESRGAYRLAASIRGFLAAIENRADTDELRGVRIALMDAQRRRIESELRDKQASAQQLDTQAGLIQWLGQAVLDGYRQIASSLHGELLGRGYSDAREIALKVEGWGVAERAQLERRLAALEAAARREQTRVTDYATADRLAGEEHGVA